MNYTNKFIYNKVNEIYKLNKSSLPTDSQRTNVFKLFTNLSGEKIEHKRIHLEIYNFFKAFVKTGKKHRWLNNIIYSDIHEKRNNEIIYNHKQKYFIPHNNLFSPNPRKYNNQIEKERALKLTREFLTNEITNYTKVPFFCFNHLYFCHPNYKHYDYNKVRTCELNINYKFCDTIRNICIRSYKKRTGIEF